jgi:hypothetical protein
MFSEDSFAYDSSQLSSSNCTPRDQQYSTITSPVRKRGKPGFMSKRIGRERENNYSLFNLAISQSQDSVLSSQGYSQDVLHKIGMLSCQGSQDSYSQTREVISHCDSFPMASGEDSSSSWIEGASNIPFLRSSTNSSSPRPFAKPEKSNKEYECFVPLPVSNPFVNITSCCAGKRKSPTGNASGSNKVTITSMRDYPRYIMDFEQEAVIGRGSFSEVYKAKRRCDGVSYAVKRLSAEIQSESEGLNMVKEVCALAVLQDCEHIVRYFGSWIECGHLWIQTELCLQVTLDRYVIKPNPQSKESGRAGS